MSCQRQRFVDDNTVFDKYNHAEFANSFGMTDFSQVFTIYDFVGQRLGRNKIFELLRYLKILRDNNVPYEGFRKYFKCQGKEHPGGIKAQVFVKKEEIKALIDRLEKCIEDDQLVYDKKSGTFYSNKSKKEQSVQSEADSSPVSMTREQAIEVLAGLPEKLRNSIMAQELRRKFDIDG